MTLRASLPDYMAQDDLWGIASQAIRRLGQEDIPCAMSIGLRRILFQTVRAMDARRVLDIGTYVGTSALTFAMAVGRGGRVVSVDTDDVNGVGGHWHKVRGAIPPASLMKSADVAERVDFVRMDARDFLECTCDRFDLISLDGWHEDFAVEREIELALDRLSPNGLIFLDDVQAVGEELPQGFDRIDGPRMALERMLKNGAPFRVVHLPRTLEGDWCAGAFLLAAEL